MKPKHITARIKQCIALSECSNCPRRKFGAIALNPERNTILAEGYNGGPRGGGELCGGHWCQRDGITGEVVELDHAPGKYAFATRGPGGTEVCTDPSGNIAMFYNKEAAETALATQLERLHKDNPPITSGTEIQIGCHHAEMNLICNAAALGTALEGAWLIVTGEPCQMCAKLLHHAGIVKVLVVAGGYMGANGVQYLRNHGVEVEEIEGPQDPRSAA